MASNSTLKRAKTILRLLEQNTSIQIVSDFLKTKGLHHSAGSWGDIKDKRILPCLKDNSLSVDELEALLINTEEFGKQHTFLYQCSKKRTANLIDSDRIASTLKSLSLGHLFESSEIIEHPKQVTVSDIRLDTVNKEPCLTIKLIETRWSIKYIGEQIKNNVITKQWQRVNERAVNVIRLHTDGLLEIRVASHSNSSQYDHELVKIWDTIEEIIPREGFSEVSLTKAKNKLLEDKLLLKNKIRFTTATLRNDYGNQIKAAAGSKHFDLSDDDGVQGSIDEFIRHEGYCDNTNIWFIKNEKTKTPAHNLHVLISGMLNEFAVPANCINNDYEYALREIRSLNK